MTTLRTIAAFGIVMRDTYGDDEWIGMAAVIVLLLKVAQSYCSTTY
jgi:hypothetical protein